MEDKLRCMVSILTPIMVEETIGIICTAEACHFPFFEHPFLLVTADDEWRYSAGLLKGFGQNDYRVFPVFEPVGVRAP